MTDIQIVEQLLNGNHLEPKELNRAEKIVANLSNELINR